MCNTDIVKSMTVAHLKKINSISDVINSVINLPAYVLMLLINLFIFNRARKQDYHFLNEEDTIALFHDVNFTGIYTEKVYVDNAILVVAAKEKEYLPVISEKYELYEIEQRLLHLPVLSIGGNIVLV